MDLTQSVDMTLSYIWRISRVRIEWSYLNKPYITEPVNRVTIAPGFWRTISCLACGKCCGDLWNIWFEDEYVPSKVNRPEQVVISVNDKQFTLVAEPHVGGERCPHQRQDGLCMVHSRKPLMCQMPPLKFRYYVLANATQITNQKYTKRWWVGKICGAVIGPCHPLTVLRDISTLGRVEHIATMLGVETHLKGALGEIQAKLPTFQTQLAFV